jgi:hypothetical protein
VLNVDPLAAITSPSTTTSGARVVTDTTSAGTSWPTSKGQITDIMPN